MKKLIIVCALSMQSCATILTGTSDRITINSVPEGAKVEIDGIDKGKTPVRVKVKRHFESPTVTLKKDGYERKTFELQNSFNPIAAINLLSIFGWGIDLLSGAVMKYNPKVYDMELEPKKP